MNADTYRRDAALEACLKAIFEEGLSVEQALSRFPGEASEIRPEVEVAVWLRQQRQVLSAHGWEIGQSRRRLENRLLRQRPDWPTYWRRLSFIRRSFQVAVMVLFLLTFARFNMKVAYASASSIPGDPLYPLKLVNEQAQLAFTFNQENEARILIEIARQRAVELESLVLEGRYDDIGPVSKKVDRSFARAQEQIQNMPASQDTLTLEEELRSTVEIQQAVLNALVGMVPPGARDQLLPLINDVP